MYNSTFVREVGMYNSSSICVYFLSFRKGVRFPLWYAGVIAYINIRHSAPEYTKCFHVTAGSIDSIHTADLFRVQCSTSCLVPGMYLRTLFCFVMLNIIGDHRK